MGNRARLTRKEATGCTMRIQKGNPSLGHGKVRRAQMRLLFTILVFSTIAFTQTITPGLNFDGIAYSNYASAPPDANVAVGATQVAQWVNARYAIYSKSSGALLYGPYPGNKGWTGSSLCATRDQGDGIVQYDKA